MVTRGVVGYFGLWARREKEVALAGVLGDPGGEQPAGVLGVGGEVVTGVDVTIKM